MENKAVEPVAWKVDVFYNYFNNYTGFRQIPFSKVFDKLLDAKKLIIKIEENDEYATAKLVPLCPAEALLAKDKEIGSLSELLQEFQCNDTYMMGKLSMNQTIDQLQKQIEELKKQIELNDEEKATIRNWSSINSKLQKQIDYWQNEFGLSQAEVLELKMEIEEIKTAFQLEEIRTKRIVLDYQSKLDEAVEKLNLTLDNVYMWHNINRAGEVDARGFLESLPEQKPENRKE